jgi:hypothetical protein
MLAGSDRQQGFFGAAGARAFGGELGLRVACPWRVQQSIAAFKQVQPCPATQTLVMSSCPELVRAGDLEVPRPAPPPLAANRLQQPMLAHQPLTALAIDRPPRAALRDRGNRPRAIGGVPVLARNRHDDAVERVSPTPLPARRSTRATVKGLAADARNTGDDRGGAASRDQFARLGDALAHSQRRKRSPAICTSIVLRPNARSSLATCPRSSSSSVRSALPCKRSAPAARNWSRHLRRALGERSRRVGVS